METHQAQQGHHLRKVESFIKSLGIFYTDQTIGVVNTKSCGNNPRESLIPMNLYLYEGHFVFYHQFAFQSSCDFILKEPFSKMKTFCST